MATKNILTNEDKLKWAVHTQELEGYQVKQETIDDYKAIIEGTLTIDDYIKKLNRKYKGHE